MGLTEVDYQTREGTNVFTVRVFYSRELVNQITIRFFPVTYDHYESVLGLTLPDGFPSRDVEASGKKFKFVVLQLHVYKIM